MNNRGFSVVVKGAIFLFLFAEVHGKTLKKRDVKCTIDVKADVNIYRPLLLSEVNGKHDFLYPLPFANGKLITHRGESFGIACPSSTIHPNTSGSFEHSLVTCDQDDDFILETPAIERPFKDIYCDSTPSSVVRKITLPTDVSCASGTPYEIGFKLDINQKFYRMIDLCFDMTKTNTLYAHAKIIAAIDSAQKSVPSPSVFRNDKLFGRKKMDEAYTIKAQNATLTAILNSRHAAERYIKKEGSYYFARGHLIAKTDFVYGAQQLATFYFANVVPMWQNINAGNWKVMEDNVRSVASLRGLDFDVWVGGYDILQLEDDKRIKRDIYLFKNGNELAIPVPKILFKVVYNYPTQTGVVLLTVNNPHLTILTDQERMCKDVCDKIRYLRWKPKEAAKGLSYCCEIDDFRKAYPNLPPFTTTNLLI